MIKKYRVTLDGIANKDESIGFARLSIYSCINKDLTTDYKEYHLVAIRERVKENAVNDIINIYVIILLEENEKPIKIERID